VYAHSSHLALPFKPDTGIPDGANNLLTIFTFFISSMRDAGNSIPPSSERDLQNLKLVGDER